MRIRLKGINSKRKRLANGEIVTYYYLGKGGPRLHGEPGSTEFMSSYNEAIARKSTPPTGVLLSILQSYQTSQAFLSNAERTRADKIKHFKIIEREFGDFPLSALVDRRTRGEFLDWRDRLAFRSRRQADYAWSTLARVLSWALDRGLIVANPCERGGRLYRGSRADKIWTADNESAFSAVASEPLRLALMLALWTGQRQGDLLLLPWSSYDGAAIRLRQSKTGARVVVPVGAPLKDALDQEKRCCPIILTNFRGTPWTANGFRSSWRKTCAAAGVTDLTFNDLRGTAVTRLALAGATEAEIATITGHALRDVRSILDAHYLYRDPALAESAIRKLESGTKTPDRVPDRA